jgi:hypothetical protein
MQLENIFYPIPFGGYVKSCKMYTFVTMLQDETKLCDSTVILLYYEIPVAH